MLLPFSFKYAISSVAATFNSLPGSLNISSKSLLQLLLIVFFAYEVPKDILAYQYISIRAL